MEAKRILKKISKYNGDVYDESLFLNKEIEAKEIVNTPKASISAAWRKMIQEPRILGYFVICAFSW